MKSAYGISREWGMRPDDFWNLSLKEFWWEFDFKLEKQKKLEPDKGKFSAAQWDAARKAHSEKLKNGN